VETTPVAAFEAPAEPVTSAEASAETAPDEAPGAPEQEASAETDEADAPPFDAQVLARLEAAFEALQGGEITLDTYAERLGEENAAVEQRIAELGDQGDPGAVEAALAARESVRWCLDWAEEQRVEE
jgi:hypothetical protein